MPGTVRPETIARYSDDTTAPFSCNQCPDREFQSPRGLMTHVQNLHYKDKKPSGRHACHCGKSYTQSNNLRLHQRKIHGAPVKPVGRPRAEAVRQPDFGSHGVKFCPCCGTNVAVVQAAMNLCG